MSKPNAPDLEKGREPPRYEEATNQVAPNLYPAQYPGQIPVVYTQNPIPNPNPNPMAPMPVGAIPILNPPTNHCHDNNTQFASSSAVLFCSNCQKNIMSRTEHVRSPDFKRYLPLLICMMILIPPLLCICPLLLYAGQFDDVIHFCPDCGALLGKYVRRNESQNARHHHY